MSRFGKVLILGAGGLLGSHVAAVLREESVAEVVAHVLPRFATAEEAKFLVAAERPSVTVNCLGYSGEDPLLHWTVNAEIPKALAGECHRARSLFIQVSTNAVFAPDDDRRWHPGDPIAPVTAYERSKAAGEDPRAYVIRASFIGKRPKGGGFFDAAMRGLPYRDRRWNGVTALALARRIREVISRRGGSPQSALEHVHSTDASSFRRLAALLRSTSQSQGPEVPAKLLGGGVEGGLLEDQVNEYLDWLTAGRERDLETLRREGTGRGA
jgi:dTDP-4-dehydrorhamnose reductase